MKTFKVTPFMSRLFPLIVGFSFVACTQFQPEHTSKEAHQEPVVVTKASWGENIKQSLSSTSIQFSNSNYFSEQPTGQLCGKSQKQISTQLHSTSRGTIHTATSLANKDLNLAIIVDEHNDTIKKIILANDESVVAPMENGMVTTTTTGKTKIYDFQHHKVFNVPGQRINMDDYLPKILGVQMYPDITKAHLVTSDKDTFYVTGENGYLIAETKNIPIAITDDDSLISAKIDKSEIHFGLEVGGSFYKFRSLSKKSTNNHYISHFQDKIVHIEYSLKGKSISFKDIKIYKMGAEKGRFINDLDLNIFERPDGFRISVDNIGNMFAQKGFAYKFSQGEKSFSHSLEKNSNGYMNFDFNTLAFEINNNVYVFDLSKLKLQALVGQEVKKIPGTLIQEYIRGDIKTIFSLNGNQITGYNIETQEVSKLIVPEIKKGFSLALDQFYKERYAKFLISGKGENKSIGSIYWDIKSNKKKIIFNDSSLSIKSDDVIVTYHGTYSTLNTETYTCLSNKVQFDESVDPFDFKKKLDNNSTKALWENVIRGSYPIRPIDFVNLARKNFNSNQFALSSNSVEIFNALLVADVPNSAKDDLLKVYAYLLYYFDFSNLMTAKSIIGVERWKQILTAQFKFENVDNAKHIFKHVAPWNPDKEFIPLAISLFRDLMKDYSKGLVHAIIKDFSDTLADRAKTMKYKGLFKSKLYYAILNSIDYELGLTDKTLVDSALARETIPLSLYFISNKPIDGDKNTRNPFGFYEKSVKIKKTKNAYNDTITQKWQAGEETYTTKAQVKSIKPFSHLVTQRKQPDYESLWRDGVLSGIVIIGQNMGNKPMLASYYKQYLLENGFSLNVLQEKADVRSFIRNQIAQNQLDYMIKEAHSDSDDLHLFRYYKYSKIWVSEKQTPLGNEVIYLIYNDDQTKNIETALFSTKELSDWMAWRKKWQGSRFYYFNTSCSSTTKAIREYEAVFESSDKLTIIPTPGSASTFSTFHTNPLNLLFTKFRGGKSYEEIRQTLKGALRGNSTVEYIFPDEESYQKSVVHYLKGPLDVQIQTFDVSGKQIFVDEVN